MNELFRFSHGEELKHDATRSREYGKRVTRHVTSHACAARLRNGGLTVAVVVS